MAPILAEELAKQKEKLESVQAQDLQSPGYSKGFRRAVHKGLRNRKVLGFFKGFYLHLHIYIYIYISGPSSL